MIKLTELLDESDASDEAQRLGLDYLEFGRWGKDGKVTHISQNGKLVPFDTRGSNVGQPKTPEDPNANLRATPLKKIPSGDYGSNEPKSSKPAPEPANINKLSSMTPKSPRKQVAVDAVNSYTAAKTKLDAAQQVLDRVPEDNPSLYDRAEQVFFAASDAFNKSKNMAQSNIDSFEWGEQHSSEEEINAARILADVGYEFLTGEDNPEQTAMLDSALDNLKYRIEDYDMSLDDDMPDKLDDVVVAAMEVAEIRSLINQGRGETEYPGSPRAKRNAMKTQSKSSDGGDYYGNDLDGYDPAEFDG